MKPIHRAIVLLQQARDIIEQEEHNTSFDDSTRRDDLNDIGDLLGRLLHHLESMDGTP